MTKIYLATKLFSFFDRLVSVQMYNAISNTESLREADIYLPFKDSNMKVSNDGNVAYNIFIADIKNLQNADIFICRLDGLSFDAGVGFELGFCFAMNIPTFVFTTDYVDSKLDDRKFFISPITDKVSYCFKYEYQYQKQWEYEKELIYNSERFSAFVQNKFSNGLFRNKYSFCPDIKDGSIDIFIDICGCHYEWNQFVISEILEKLGSMKITYWISNRYCPDYSFQDDINALCSCKLVLICLDENEPNLDSCILQGIAYFQGKEIIGYESNKVLYYLKDKQQMGVNLMVEQACSYIASSLEEVINLIKEKLIVQVEKNEAEKN